MVSMLHSSEFILVDSHWKRKKMIDAKYLEPSLSKHFTLFCCTSLWPLSDQLNQRMMEGRIQGKDQDKGQKNGQSEIGSAMERSERRGVKTRRCQGNWIGISMMKSKEDETTMGKHTVWLGLELVPVPSPAAHL